MTAGKIILLIMGLLGVLITSGLLAGGGALIWIDATVKDSDGFYTSGTIDIQRDSYAVISQPAQINVRGAFMGDWSDLATFKVEGVSNGESRGIFIGIARERDVRQYLLNVKHDEITRFSIHPTEVDYEANTGEALPQPPGERTFWIDSAHGIGNQRMEWEVETGTYVLVLMNEDGSPGIDMGVAVGAKIPSLIWIAVGFLIGGVFALVISAVLIYFAVRKP